MNHLRIIFSITLSAISITGISQNLEVCSHCAFTTIKEALAAAVDGDCILVKPGRYQENPIIIDKAVTLTGTEGAVLVGEAGKEMVIIAANGVTLEGLRLENLPVSYLKDLAAIRVQRRSNFTIRNNLLVNTFFGIYLEYAEKGTVADNIIIGEAREEASSGNGIHAWYCKGVRIANNIVKGHRDGIYFEFVDRSTVSNNISENNLRYGLHFMFSNDDVYSENVFRDNGAGVAVMFSKNIDMHHNRFDHNWGRASYGLLLKEIYDAEITDNEFIQNTIGINIEGATRINYTDNVFRSNGWALKMSGGCLDNHLSNNDFIANTLDVVVNSRVNNNTFDGNYWSDYSGYDLDRDGRGDVPHRPVKLFSFIVNRTPEAIILLRSLFVDLVNFAEKVSPAFTPAGVLDHSPLMKPVS